MSDQTKVRVSFDYYPDEPDLDDETGMSTEEFEDLMDKLGQLGADNPEVKKIGP
jgi:hypothetical protein